MPDDYRSYPDRDAEVAALKSRVEDLEEIAERYHTLVNYVIRLHGEVAKAGVKLESAAEHLRGALARRPKDM